MSNKFTGRHHEFERKRARVNRGSFFMLKLEELEKTQDLKEERFLEMDTYLGQQYCEGLDPSVVGFKRCVYHLVIEQSRIHLIVLTIFFIEDKIWQLCIVFLLHNVYFVLQLTYVKAFSRKLRIIESLNCFFCLWVSYYQFLALLEDSVAEISDINMKAWLFNGLFFLHMLMNIDRMCFLGLQKQFKRAYMRNKSQEVNKKLKAKATNPSSQLYIDEKLDPPSQD